jgi:hypothetical protein
MERSPAGSLEQKFEPLLATFHASSRRALLKVLNGLGSLPAAVRSEVEEIFAQAAGSLPLLLRSLEAWPVRPRGEGPGRSTLSGEALAEALCRDDWLPHHFTVPTGALVGRTLVHARVDFYKSLCHSLQRSSVEWVEPVVRQICELADNAVYSTLAEEILTYAVSNHRNSEELRKAAARKLLSIWSHRNDQEIGDFPTVLLSAWKARSRVKTIYGTLFGSEEILSLIRCECEPRFVNYFLRDQVTPGEAQAFREFLFGLPHEDLQVLQAYMNAHGLNVISRDQVREILGRRATYTSPMDSEPTAEAIFASYNRRRIRADYRVLSGSPGPLKTAEGYIIEALLREESGLSAASGERPEASGAAGGAPGGV